MTSRLAILCPGQGTQHRAMFDLARTDAHVALQLDQWISCARLDAPLDAVLSDAALLFANRMAQPLIVAATLAMWEAIKNDVPPPLLAAGYSIGEIAAYGVAGALAPGDAIALAASRAQLMDVCLETMPRQALVAISGLPTQSAEALLQPHDFHVAIETGEDSFIAGGPADLVIDLQREVVAAGGRASLLPVEIAAHTPFMRAAVAPFYEALRRHRLSDPRFPVLSGISAERIDQTERAIAHLSRQIAETILWKDCMDACAEAGVTVALELGPGASLSRMLQARHPQIACRSVADFRSLGGIRQWLARHID
jgi:[acyl-carrier-protein] S-malonyltransferase